MVAQSTIQVINRRYVLQEELGRGGMGIVHRATDRLTGQPVALKQVTTPAEYLQLASRMDDDSENFRLALAHEFKILSSLRHPNIVSVLDYGFDKEMQPYFTMTLLDNACTLLEAAREQPLEVQIDLIIQ